MNANETRNEGETNMVTDGYFTYEVLADTADGWLTVRLFGHILRVRKEDMTAI